MLFAIGTPVGAYIKPWIYDWGVSPDALMISAIDFIEKEFNFKKLRKKSLPDILEWDKMIICDSGAFSLLNQRKKIQIHYEQLKSVYKILQNDSPHVIKLSLDFPDDKILENYLNLQSLEVMPVVPYYDIKLIEQILQYTPDVRWLFIGRLVPLMRKKSYRQSITKILPELTAQLQNIEPNFRQKHKIWALGIGAPTLFSWLPQYVDGSDSSRWRITAGNMILLPGGGERGVGKVTKWTGTKTRIKDGKEKNLVISLLRHILMVVDNFSAIDKKIEAKVPKTKELESKIKDEPSAIRIKELEELLSASGYIRLYFNYLAALESFYHFLPEI